MHISEVQRVISPLNPICLLNARPIGVASSYGSAPGRIRTPNFQLRVRRAIHCATLAWEKKEVQYVFILMSPPCALQTLWAQNCTQPIILFFVLAFNFLLSFDVLMWHWVFFNHVPLRYRLRSLVLACARLCSLSLAFARLRSLARGFSLVCLNWWPIIKTLLWFNGLLDSL